MITDFDKEYGSLTGEVVFQIRTLDVRRLDSRNNTGPKHHDLVSNSNTNPRPIFPGTLTKDQGSRQTPALSSPVSSPEDAK